LRNGESEGEDTMPMMTFELPETLKAHVEERIAQGDFPDANAYLQSLIANDRRRAEIDKLLLEAEDAYERGEYTVHKPGDFQRMYEELKRQREQAAKP
jgi:Arc/MetJ-type ribon-helix-helix transcriptional regulator